ncbi:hypothetical protein [Pseudomonas chlororaphis]|uniref:Uncharacterized protein n=1 Tax=Pseudomonas chlororaphis subsp. aurantiaca TaxID=86192 RepID=A0AAJ0ZJI8_9PSED|nr:hypothetical protein [Pseudomonas chlororaphis]MBU4633478.1 hypothetical protein [Pseudomonas chlororaphis subsp. aurantiaca]
MGVTLIMLAIKLNRFLTFDPIYLVGQRREWLVGPREIAHLIGIAGCTVGGWYFISSFASKLLICWNLALTVAFVVGVASMGPESQWLYDAFGITPLELYVNLSTIYLGAWIWLALTAWAVPNMLRFRPALIISCIFMVVTIGLWELYTQPFVHVYDGPARGWIQASQVACDLLGVLVGALLVLFTNYQARRP